VFQTYLNKRITEATELLSSANPYTQIRAQSNLKQSALLFDNSRSMAVRDSGVELQSRNDVLLRDAEQQVQQQQAAQQTDGRDNRSRLNSYWSDQGVKRSKNVVSGLKSNFDGAEEGRVPDGKEGTFNKAWLDQNALGTRGDKSGGGAKGEADKREPQKPGEGQDGWSKFGGRFSRDGGRNYSGDNAKPQAEGGEQGQGQAGQAEQNPQLFNDQQKDQLQQKLQKEVDEVQDESGLSNGKKDSDNLFRYGQNLDRNVQQQEQGGLAAPANQPPGQPMAPGGGPGSGFGSGGGQGMGGMAGGWRGGAQAGGQPGASAPGLQQFNGQAPADPSSQPATAASTAATSGTPAPVVVGDTYENVAAGLASLDFRLPERGRIYSFTTPRGQIEISARPVAHTLIGRLIGLVALGAVVLIVWAATRQPARDAYHRLFSTVACGLLLALVGLVSLITGIFPFAGLLLIVIGIVLAIRNRTPARAVVA
jgi:hypothetical protein